jgi:type II secretory pathway pseudopilin PulG
MVTGRRGHSLPELIVALTLLGATLAGVASTAVLGSRWTTDAVMRQRALTLAESVLDSLVGSPGMPGSGEVTDLAPPWVVQWAVEPLTDTGAARVRVTVAVPHSVTAAHSKTTAHSVTAGDRPLAELHGLWIPPLPGPLP